MATNQDETRLRRYLLGELAEAETAALELDYFARDESLHRVWAAEEDLIDDYLANRLSDRDRDRFERHYLAAPIHRDRVAVVRELKAAGSAAPGAASVPSPSWRPIAAGVPRKSPRSWRPALAAALVVLAIGGVWMFRARTAPTVAVDSSAATTRPATGTQPPSSPRPAPVVITLTLSPVSVRGTDEGAILILNPGTDGVRLRLESEPNAPALVRGRATVRTVSGNEVWSGATAADQRGAPSAIAHLEIPADRLVPEDYIVTLFDSGRDGQEVERSRYFLRVRSR